MAASVALRERSLTIRLTTSSDSSRRSPDSLYWAFTVVERIKEEWG